MQICDKKKLISIKIQRIFEMSVIYHWKRSREKMEFLSQTKIKFFEMQKVQKKIFN